MPDLRTMEHIDFETIMLLADFHQWQCEDVTVHKAGMHYHQPDAPAAFLVVNKCCGDRALMCAPRVAYLRNAPEIHCTGCGGKWPPEDYRFIPLPEVL